MKCMKCDKCRGSIPLSEPITTCNIVDAATYNWVTYNLCDKCTEELFKFLGEKTSNMEE